MIESRLMLKCRKCVYICCLFSFFGIQAAIFHHTVYNKRQPQSRIVLPPYDECLMHFELDFTTSPYAGRSACLRPALQQMRAPQVVIESSAWAILSSRGGSLFLFKVSSKTVYFFSDSLKCILGLSLPQDLQTFSGFPRENIQENSRLFYVFNAFEYTDCGLGVEVDDFKYNGTEHSNMHLFFIDNFSSFFRLSGS